MQKSNTPTGTPPSPAHRGMPTRTDADEKGKPSSEGSTEEVKPVQNREDALDDALEETFPASDPVSIVPEKPQKPKKPKS